MIELQLKPREEARIKAGHLWVYRDELVEVPEADAGSLARVRTYDGTSLGTGFYNPISKIAVRMLGAEVEVADDAFFTRRFRQAQALRERVLPGESAYRVVFGEADLMSGLIVDRYNKVFVIQMLAAGMDIRIDAIIAAIRAVFPDVEGIIEKNTMQTRVKEGIEMREGVVWGSVGESVDIKENGILLRIDLIGGQKTGYFLDQKMNRRTVGALSHGKRVLDCFCNVGGFALNAAMGGAAEAVGIDSSTAAVEAATRNAELNGFTNARFEKANVFDDLRARIAREEQWDIIVLDPPSFAKARSAIKGALAGYAELNRTAMKLLSTNGILVTASCTQLVPESTLMDIMYREAARLRKRLRLLHRGEQAPDHPILLAMPETQYLKFLVFDVIDA
ncbi:MAG: class I SAM-dependent rRNA methyltransferase [bacterium]|nr:class I SAM-dependent rRNA methyltransferase [bacterium]